MNDLLPPPDPDQIPLPPPPATAVASPSDRSGSWAKAVAATIALDILAALAGLTGAIVWFALLWDGAVSDALWLPLLAVCLAPAIAIWVGSGWLASRLAGTKSGWWLLLLAPVVGSVVGVLLGL